MMRRQTSTAMSDLILALSAIWGYRMLHQTRGSEHQFGKWWFMLETLAASLGVVRFAALLPSYQTSVVKYHTNFSWLCRAIGLPCLAAEVCKMYGYHTVSQGFLICAMATFVTSSLKSQHKERLTETVSALCVVTMLGLSVAGSSFMIGAASILFIISGIIGSEGQIKLLRMPRVDALHYTLVATNYCLAWGILTRS